MIIRRGAAAVNGLRGANSTGIRTLQRWWGCIASHMRRTPERFHPACNQPRRLSVLEVDHSAIRDREVIS